MSVIDLMNFGAESVNDLEREVATGGCPTVGTGGIGNGEVDFERGLVEMSRSWSCSLRTGGAGEAVNRRQGLAPGDEQMVVSLSYLAVMAYPARAVQLDCAGPS